MTTNTKCFSLIDPKVGGEVGRHYTEDEAQQLAQEWINYWGYPLIVQQTGEVKCC